MLKSGRSKTIAVRPTCHGYLLAAALAALALSMGPACSSDEETSSEACEDEDPVAVQGHDENAMHRAQVSLTSGIQIDGASGTEKRDNSITASFSDITAVETSSRAQDTNIGGFACFGLTGSPTTKCREGFSEPCVVEALDVDTVIVEGLEAGTRQLNRASTGKFSDLEVPEPFLGSLPITVNVTGRDDQAYFPSYDQTLEPPQELVLQAPDPDGGQPVGPSDIRFRWKPGDKDRDLITIDIASTDQSITDKVKCYVLDDGCHTLLPDALEWLEIAQGDTFRVTVTRSRRTVKSLDSNHSVLLQVNSRIQAQFTR